MNEPNSILEAALQYHELGISTIPIAIGSKSPPRNFKWTVYAKRRPTISEIRDWHDRTQDIFSLAVVSGAVSDGLLIRDFDVEGALDRWLKKNLAVARDMPLARTPDGYHLWCRSSITDHHEAAGGGELRGDGHYSLAPTSPAYWWIRPPSSIPFIADPSILLDTAHRRLSSPLPAPSMQTDAVNVSDEEVERAISSTLPPHFGTRNSSILALCRALRSLFPDATADAMREHVELWHQRAIPTIGDPRDRRFSQTWRQFSCAFPKTVVDGGFWGLAVAIARVSDSPKDTDSERLLRLCKAMHQAAGGGPFALSCRKAGRYLGVGHDKANRMITALVQNGSLVVHAKYPIGPQSTMAYEYRFIVGGSR